MPDRDPALRRLVRAARRRADGRRRRLRADRLPARRRLAPAVRPGRDALGPDPPDADRRRRDDADRQGDPARRGHALARSGGRERRPSPLRPRASLAGGFLIGLSTFQAEFDFGVPQFDFVFQPMLIALAAGIGLVSARLWGGRGAALGAVAFFLVVRGFVSLMVAGVLGESAAALPALPRRGAAGRGRRGGAAGARGPLAFGAVAGLLIGTVGIAAEWGWSHVWMPLPWPAALLPEVAVVTRARRPRRRARRRVDRQRAARASPQPFPRGARVVFPLAGLVVAGLVAFGLADLAAARRAARRCSCSTSPGGGPREVTAVVTARPAAGRRRRQVAHHHRLAGRRARRRPPRRASARASTARTSRSRSTATGRPRSASTAAARCSACRSTCPNDPAIPAKEVPARASFARPFVRDKQILQREAKAGRRRPDARRLCDRARDHALDHRAERVGARAPRHRHRGRRRRPPGARRTAPRAREPLPAA